MTIYVPDTGVVPVSGTTLFEIWEARAFDGGRLESATLYSDEDIAAAAERIAEFFWRVCGVSFLTQVIADEQHDGDGTPVLMLDETRIQSIEAASIDGVALDATQIDPLDYDAGLAIGESGRITRRSGYWTSGEGNVLVSYTHGYDAVPAQVKRAALILCVNQMQESNLSDRVTSYSDGSGSYQLAYAGAAPHWTGIPEVDATLAHYNESLVGVA